GAEVAVVEGAGLVLAQLDDPAGPIGEALEHGHTPPRDFGRRRRLSAYFLWTAWRLTPRAVAICCHDQPWSRALTTWRVSRVSSNRRRAATARSPTTGSRLPASAANCV